MGIAAEVLEFIQHFRTKASPSAQASPVMTGWSSAATPTR